MREVWGCSRRAHLGRGWVVLVDGSAGPIGTQRGGGEVAGVEERRKERAARRRSVSSAAKAARRGVDGRNVR
jgi:hypothetical protein